MAIGAYHCEVCGHVVCDGAPLLQGCNRARAMRFNKAFADGAITLSKIPSRKLDSGCRGTPFC